MENSSKLNIKQWAIDDRPREKLLAKGINALSDAELIAILIGSGNRNETAVELSKRILQSNDNKLNDLGRKSVADLTKFKGIGEAKAISIVAALELGRRRKASDLSEQTIIQCSNDIFEYCYSFLGDLNYEEFWIIHLNHAHKIIGREKISQGGISSTVIDIKLIMKSALDKLASNLILCHNHPSGNLNPGIADKEITAKIENAARFFDIKVLDHIIIGDSNFLSFCDEGLLGESLF